MHRDTGPRIVCKFREIWPAEVAYLTKTKKSASAPDLASARIAPKICQGQLQTIYSECPKFRQIRSLPVEL